MVRLILAAILVSGCVAANAQQKKKPAAKPAPAAATTAFPIEILRVEGLKEYTQAQVEGVLGLKVGQHAAKKEFDDARQRLLATGAFETVSFRFGPAPDGKGYAVTYEVTEASPRFPVRFEDLGAPDAELLAALKKDDPMLARAVPATDALIARYAKVIEGVLAARGKSVKVAGKLEPDDDGQVFLWFRPAGARPVVARVTFQGNSVLASTTLENAMNAVAVGQVYREPRFRQLLDSQIRPLYEARGRVRVTFPEFHTAQEAGVKGLVVTVKVDEGAPFTLGKVDLAGTGLGQVELKKYLAEFKAGTPYNRELVLAGGKKVEGRLKRLGFMRVKSRLEPRIDDQAKKVDVTIRYEPGQRYTFGTLTIEGLDLLSEPEIRKMWGVKEGDPFNSDYPDHFLREIKSQGIFENLGATKAALKVDDEVRRVDVTLSFKGAPPKPKKKPMQDEPTPEEPPI